MNHSRKNFLKNAALLIGGSMLPVRNFLYASDNKNTPPLYCANLADDTPPFPDIVETLDEKTNPLYRYRKDSVSGFSDVILEKDKDEPNCSYTEDECILNNDVSQLFFKIYYPRPETYGTTTQLPVFVYFHPGGFMECSHYDTQDSEQFCREMAKRGFVTFNVEYRRGRAIQNFTYTSVFQQSAAYRASQDARGALRSIIKKIGNGDFNSLFTTTDKLFIGGVSAGAVMCINAAYYRTQDMVNAAFPSIGTYSIQDVLGTIDNESFYYAENIAQYDYRPHLKGVMLGWGGHGFPLTGNKITFFTDNATNPYDNPSVIAFHGALDNIFPISPGIDGQNQNVYFSGNTLSGDYYNHTNFCLNENNSKEYQLETDETTRDLFSISSKDIYNMVKTLNNRIAEMYIDCQMYHGLDGSDSLPTADFGTGLAIDLDVWTYMAKRTATFFQAILNGYTQTQLGNSIFQDCVNYRFGCNLPNSICPPPYTCYYE